MVKIIEKNNLPPSCLLKWDAWTLGTGNKGETAAEDQLQPHNDHIAAFKYDI